MKKNKREYIPDSWKIIKIKTKDKIYFRVLGGWSGGYLDGDSWRMSSGIENIKFSKKDNMYYIKNASGSTYKCLNNCEGFILITGGIFEKIKEQSVEMGIEVEPIDVANCIKELKNESS